MNCIDFIKTSFFIFSGEVPQLLYYSHLPAFFISIFVGIWVYLSARKSLEAKIFLIVSIIFSALSLNNLITWTNSNSQIVSISWIFSIEFFNWLMFLLAYFFYVFINKKDVEYYIKMIGLFLLFVSPFFILSNFGITNFDLNSCELVISNNYYLYQIFINIIAVLYIIFTFINNFLKVKTNRKENSLFFIATIIFVGFFLATWHLSSLFDIFIYEQVGYIGFVIFIATISYIIVRFKAFDIKLIGSQALIIGIVVLIGSQFFFIQNNTNRILTAITLVLSIAMGFLIVRSVKKEIFLRERIQTLVENLERANSNLKHINIDLDKANEKLKELDQLKTEFVGLATHQIRGPLTAIKGYLSMMLEGDYGKIPKSIEDSLRVIFSSAESLSVVVSDFLNVSRIEQGQMKYNMEDCDVKELVIEVIKELKPNTESRGLELKADIPDEPFVVHIDKEKIKQVINNLIDNSSKYTKVGSINVSLQKTDNSKILLAIKDTGVGISKETLPHLFEKFSRAKDAFKTNILGTGLGLYVARKMMEAHKGRVWAESEGEGKGSQFYVEFEGVK